MRILFTGGGTAGHVTPNLGLMSRLAEEGWDVHYAGSRAGIERELVARTAVPYHPLPTGKLRRYLSLQNLLDLFRVIAGIFAGWQLCRRLRPDVVFSKGGFVSVPVVVGARLSGIPVVAHESDLSAGLATRLVAPLVTSMCINFPDTRVLRAKRVVHTGSPLRQGLLDGDRTAGLALAGLPGRRPVLLVVGGSLGSARINALVREALDALLERFEIIHVCGRGHLAGEIRRDGYAQFEFVAEPYADLLAAADLALSRAGANGLFELMAARVPTLLVPLTTAGSRGDQIENAAWATERGLARQVAEETLTAAGLVAELDALAAAAGELSERLAALERPDAAALILAELRAAAAA